MTRLIDADELRKEIDKQAYPYRDSTANDIYFRVLHLLTDAPTVDAVPVIRCVDCDYFKLVDGMGICKCSDDLWQTNDFCSYGEPKKGE